jgi:multidrug efflux system membrane fusion protein
LTPDASHGPLIGPEDRFAAPVPGHRWNKIRRLVLWGLLLLVLAVAVVFLWRHFEGARKVAPAPPKVSVTTATARKGDIGVYLDAIGTVTPVTTDLITSQVSGLVVAVHFKEGQRVNAGDPLVDVDPRAYRATLLQAQGALERDEDLLAQARMDLERYRESLSLKAIARQIVDDQEKLVLQDEGTVKNDLGIVQYDQLQVDFCHITAPIGGRVGLRLVDPGNVVQSAGGVTLAVITQLEPITVIFTIAEDSLSEVESHLDKKAKLAVDVYDRSAQKKIASGELLALDSQIDTTTGTVKGRASFANRDEALYPNAFVNARLLVQTLEGVTLVPASAIQQNGDASFVYLLQDGIAHRRSVKPGVTEAGVTQIEGVDPGDVVANSSFDKLQDNTAVTAVAAPPAAAVAPAPDAAAAAAPTGSKGP